VHNPKTLAEEMQKIFTIKDRFDIPGKGLALTGITENDNLCLEIGSTITIKRLSTVNIQAEVLGFELLKNCFSPNKPRNMAILVNADIGLMNVPVDSEVWQ
jgi:hypothetical protein